MHYENFYCKNSWISRLVSRNELFPRLYTMNVVAVTAASLSEHLQKLRTCPSAYIQGLLSNLEPHLKDWLPTTFIIWGF